MEENFEDESTSSDNESNSSDDVSDLGEGYLPNRIHALDIDNDTLGAARMHPEIDTIDEVYRIESAFNDRREYFSNPSMVMVMEMYRGPIVEGPTFQSHRIQFNANQIINRWESELDSFGLNMAEATRGITFKAFSNYTDIIEDLIDENLALKSVINAKNSDLEKLTLELGGKTPASLLNKLPQEIENKVRTFLGGRRRYRRLKYLFS
tara:strand:+ start:4296 stop:4919 length:624 start_codon:yes stop_codon:yes gene_type:complete